MGKKYNISYERLHLDNYTFEHVYSENIKEIKEDIIYLSCYEYKHLGSDLVGILDKAIPAKITYFSYSVYPIDDMVRRPPIKVIHDKLDKMKLMIVYVTKELLEKESYAYDVEVKYALTHNIPILPIGYRSEGIEPLFNKYFQNTEMVYLDGYSEQELISRLRRYYEFFKREYFDKGETDKIRNAFISHAFLSYRKADKKYALKIFKTLDLDEELLPYSLWYDDFLTPGEGYGEEIKSAIEKSEFVIFLITPRLFERGNYVKEIEYPLSVSLKKKMIGVEMERVDRYRLKKEYPEITTIISYKEEKDRFIDTVKKLYKSSPQKELSAEDYHYLSIAYQTGVDVSKDNTIANKLNEKARELGYAPIDIKPDEENIIITLNEKYLDNVYNIDIDELNRDFVRYKDDENTIMHLNVFKSYYYYYELHYEEGLECLKGIDKYLETHKGDFDLEIEAVVLHTIYIDGPDENGLYPYEKRKNEVDTFLKNHANDKDYTASATFINDIFYLEYIRELYRHHSEYDGWYPIRKVIGISKYYKVEKLGLESLVYSHQSTTFFDLRNDPFNDKIGPKFYQDLRANVQGLSIPINYQVALNYARVASVMYYNNVKLSDYDFNTFVEVLPEIFNALKERVELHAHPRRYFDDDALIAIKQLLFYFYDNKSRVNKENIGSFNKVFPSLFIYLYKTCLELEKEDRLTFEIILSDIKEKSLYFYGKYNIPLENDLNFYINDEVFNFHISQYKKVHLYIFEIDKCQSLINKYHDDKNALLFLLTDLYLIKAFKNDLDDFKELRERIDNLMVEYEEHETIHIIIKNILILSDLTAYQTLEPDKKQELIDQLDLFGASNDDYFIDGGVSTIIIRDKYNAKEYDSALENAYNILYNDNTLDIYKVTALEAIMLTYAYVKKETDEEFSSKDEYYNDVKEFLFASAYIIKQLIHDKAYPKCYLSAFTAMMLLIYRTGISVTTFKELINIIPEMKNVDWCISQIKKIYDENNEHNTVRRMCLYYWRLICFTYDLYICLEDINYAHKRIKLANLVLEAKDKYGNDITFVKRYSCYGYIATSYNWLGDKENEDKYLVLEKESEDV